MADRIDGNDDGLPEITRAEWSTPDADPPAELRRLVRRKEESMLDSTRPSSRSYRQGDVLLVPCASIPVTARPEAPEDGRVVLARGETTGHAHVMAADRVCHFREDGTGGGFVRVGGDDPVALTHEEHAPLMVPPGSYRLVRQREYQPRELPRAVAD